MQYCNWTLNYSVLYKRAFTWDWVGIVVYMHSLAYISASVSEVQRPESNKSFGARQPQKTWERQRPDPHRGPQGRKQYNIWRGKARRKFNIQGQRPWLLQRPTVHAQEPQARAEHLQLGLQARPEDPFLTLIKIVSKLFCCNLMYNKSEIQ